MYPVVFLPAYGLPVCAGMAGVWGGPLLCAQGTVLAGEKRLESLRCQSHTDRSWYKILCLGTHFMFRDAYPQAFFIPSPETFSSQNKLSIKYRQELF